MISILMEAAFESTASTSEAIDLVFWLESMLEAVPGYGKGEFKKALKGEKGPIEKAKASTTLQGLIQGKLDTTSKSLAKAGEAATPKKPPGQLQTVPEKRKIPPTMQPSAQSDLPTKITDKDGNTTYYRRKPRRPSPSKDSGSNPKYAEAQPLRYRAAQEPRDKRVYRKGRTRPTPKTPSKTRVTSRVSLGQPAEPAIPGLSQELGHEDRKGLISDLTRPMQPQETRPRKSLRDLIKIPPDQMSTGVVARVVRKNIGAKSATVSSLAVPKTGYLNPSNTRTQVGVSPRPQGWVEPAHAATKSTQADKSRSSRILQARERLHSLRQQHTLPWQKDRRYQNLPPGQIKHSERPPAPILEPIFRPDADIDTNDPNLDSVRKVVPGKPAQRFKKVARYDRASSPKEEPSYFDRSPSPSPDYRARRAANKRTSSPDEVPSVPHIANPDLETAHIPPQEFERAAAKYPREPASFTDPMAAIHRLRDTMTKVPSTTDLAHTSATSQAIRGEERKRKEDEEKARKAGSTAPPGEPIKDPNQAFWDAARPHLKLIRQHDLARERERGEFVKAQDEPFSKTPSGKHLSKRDKIQHVDRTLQWAAREGGHAIPYANWEKYDFTQPTQDKRYKNDPAKPMMGFSGKGLKHVTAMNRYEKAKRGKERVLRVKGIASIRSRQHQNLQDLLKIPIDQLSPSTIRDTLRKNLPTPITKGEYSLDKENGPEQVITKDRNRRRAETRARLKRAGKKVPKNLMSPSIGFQGSTSRYPPGRPIPTPPLPPGTVVRDDPTGTDPITTRAAHRKAVRASMQDYSKAYSSAQQWHAINDLLSSSNPEDDWETTTKKWQERSIDKTRDRRVRIIKGGKLVHGPIDISPTSPNPFGATSREHAETIRNNLAHEVASLTGRHPRDLLNKRRELDIVGPEQEHRQELQTRTQALHNLLGGNEPTAKDKEIAATMGLGGNFTSTQLALLKRVNPGAFGVAQGLLAGGGRHIEAKDSKQAKGTRTHKRSYRR